MRILIATDAWHPQVNGVVTTYERLIQECTALGTEMAVLTPKDFRTVPCPGYPEIRLALPSHRRLERAVAATRPDHIHIATEGVIGWMTRSYCLRHGLPFTTSYHTKFPEYVSAWLAVPERWTYRLLARFHQPSAGIMVATASLGAELSQQGFSRLMAWTRGVDAERFRPRDVRLFGSAEPVFLYAGRVSREKNIEAFLDANLPGRKVVVGDGPHLVVLSRRYPDVLFTGAKSGEDLARHFASADVFVFPSRTDTFGLVLLEAMASGVPVAAFPVTGPIDVVADGRSGVLDWDLARAAEKALALDRAAVRAHALTYSWRRAAELFLENVRVARERASQRIASPERKPEAGPAGRVYKPKLPMEGWTS